MSAADSEPVEKKKRRIVKADNEAVVDVRSKISARQKGAAAVIESKSQTSTSRWSLAHEEQQAMERDPRKDLELHRSVCSQLREALESIRAAKRGGVNDPSTLEALVKHGTLQFVSMKKLNRMGHFRNKKIKEVTSEAKQNVDEQHLRLQNLLYEIMHLKREVSKCLSYRSSDEDITLVDVEQFYTEAPPEISQPDVTRTDEHRLTLARLNWELEERKRLSERLAEMKKNKEQVSGEIVSKKNYLSSLRPKLNAIQQATKPVQEYMKMPYDETVEQLSLARDLPSSLYVLYVQAVAYRDACKESGLTVNIKGDVDQLDAEKEVSPDTDLDSDNNTDTEEDRDTAVKPSTSSCNKPKRHHRRSDVHEVRLVRRRARLTHTHPLNVTIAIPCHLDNGQAKVTVELQLSYMTSLNVVVVCVRLSGTETLGSVSVSGADLLSADTLLDSLYTGDTGLDSPNPATKFLLTAADVTDLSSCLPTGSGRPYRWAQELCGLQFPGGVEEGRGAGRGIEEVVGRIRERVRVRVSLGAQLSCLEQGSIAPCPLTPQIKILSRLFGWRRSTFADFSAEPHAGGAVRLGLGRGEDFYFTACIERGSARIDVWVVVGVRYPQVPPLVLLRVKWRGERTGESDEGVRGVECEVNIQCVDEVRRSLVGEELLLSAQLHKLLLCCDVYLETAGGVGEGPVEMCREKRCVRERKGCERGRPLLYNNSLTSLTHR